MAYRILIKIIGFACIFYGVAKLAILAMLISPDLRDQYLFVVSDSSAALGPWGLQLGLLISAVSALVWLAAGIGLLSRRHWARVLLVVSSLLIVTLTAGLTGIGLYFVIKFLGCAALAGLLFNPLANRYFNRFASGSGPRAN